MKNLFLALGALATSFVTSGAVADEPGTANGEWHHYTGDIKGSRYTPLIKSMRITLKTLKWSGTFLPKTSVHAANISLK